MRILVTGAAGFIGSWVVRALLDRDEEVIGTFRPGSVVPSDLPRNEKFTGWPADLDDPVAVDALARGARPDVTIHMAWYADPATYLRSTKNIDSLAISVKLARATYEHGCRRFVGAGTCIEYAPQDRLRTEDDPILPSTLYGTCKRAASLAIEGLATTLKKEFSWARLFHIHGPGDATGRLIPSIVDRLRREASIEMTEGTQLRDQLHVADVGAAMAAIATHGEGRGVFNVCSGEPVALRTVAETVAGFLGRPDLLRFGAQPLRPGEVMFLAGDATRLRNLGWAPQFSLEAGLRDAVVSALQR